MRRTSCCAGAAPRCRCARCSSTRGRSSSTTSATRARCRTSTPATSTAGSPSPPGCSSSPTRSSPPSATPCAPRREPGRAGPRRRGPAHRPARAGGVPGRAVRRGRLVAHRPLRLDLRTAARARHHRRSTSSARCCAAATRTGSATGWATTTHPAPYAGSTTPCSRRTARRTSGCSGNAHRRAALEARLEKLTGGLRISRPRRRARGRGARGCARSPAIVRDVLDA